MIERREPRTEEELALLRDGPQAAFPSAVEAEASAMAAVAVRLAGERKEASNLRALALDDASTVEVDDALAVETGPMGTTVHVFICDVACAVTRGSMVDSQAAGRSVTAYHPAARVPMLPEILSSDALSLVPGQRRCVLDHQLRFDNRMNLFDSSVVPCAMALGARLTYEEADALLASDEASEVGEQLDLLQEVADQLFARRVSRGALSFYPMEVRTRVDHGQVTLTRFDTGSPARRLVAEFMIAAGACVGGLLEQLKVPAIYRQQAAPDEPVAWTPEKARDPVFIAGTLRKLKRAAVTLQAGPHASLGVSTYCQVTSPLRRYSDLLMQRQIHSVLTRGVPEYGDGELLAAMVQADAKAAETHRLEREAEEYWRLVALEKLKGQKVKAMVVFNDRKQYPVLLPDFGVHGRYFPRRLRSQGEAVELVVVQADPALGAVVLRED
jgi:exoribonuclease-2